jgi:hypothetical protein
MSLREDFDQDLLVWALEEYELKVDYDMPCKGLYCPDELVLYYNPREIENNRDFYITVLHEVGHALDTQEIYSELEIEDLATGWARTRRYRYIVDYFISDQKGERRGDLWEIMDGRDI